MLSQFDSVQNRLPESLGRLDPGQVIDLIEDVLQRSSALMIHREVVKMFLGRTGDFLNPFL